MPSRSGLRSRPSHPGLAVTVTLHIVHAQELEESYRSAVVGVLQSVMNGRARPDGRMEPPGGYLGLISAGVVVSGSSGGSGREVITIDVNPLATAAVTIAADLVRALARVTDKPEWQVVLDAQQRLAPDMD